LQASFAVFVLPAIDVRAFRLCCAARFRASSASLDPFCGCGGLSFVLFQDQAFHRSSLHLYENRYIFV
jgi:hypothetical protein